MIRFTIPGNPIPLKRHRVSRNGGMYDPSSKDKKQVWLQIAKWKPKRPFAGDIMIKLVFTMERPKNQYRTGKYKHLLKDNVSEYHSYKPDLDNMVKLICDVIQGKDRMICDDSQICMLQAEKVWGFAGKTEVVIEEI
tara:strand:+ start:1895 stop:2305 length:411 start_codon:yes stop_codon:yes gene_type:complete